MPTVHLLDYVAGNVRSLVNAIEKVGYTVEWVKSPADVSKAEVCFTYSRAHHYWINCLFKPCADAVIPAETHYPRCWPLRALYEPTV